MIILSFDAEFCYSYATFGADSGFDGISEARGARRGAVGLVNKPQKNSRKRRTIRF